MNSAYRPVVLLLLALLIASSAPAQTRKPDVVFVPTDPAVVDEMLRMAEISKDDIVYDLGCGDGRLVITAAKQYGARGVGIDIDPQRIAESKENASKAGVTGRVKFFVGDLFEADFHEATAVTLYLLPELNVKLRPTLMKQLKPGTPVVSHDFDMGDWEPDEKKVVTGATRDHTVYKWIIPVNVAGVWRWTQRAPSGNISYSLVLHQTFQKLSGALHTNGKEAALPDILLVGDQISFQLPESGERFIARLRGGSLEGSSSAADGRQIAWTATRVQTAEMKMGK